MTPQKKAVDDFLTLHEIEWSRKVSAKASLCLKEGLYNRPTQLPDKDDVLKLASFMVRESASALEELTADRTNAVHYNRLMMVTLASVIVFNRKRPGDAHRMTVATYQKAPTEEKTHDDIYNSLTDNQRRLVNSLKRVETRGKKFMKVPILFTPKMQKAINLMLSVREQCGIAKDNKFVFAKVGTTAYLRGSDAIRYCREESGCIHPERVTSTCLRKEAATLAKVVGLTEQEVEELAVFLGHTKTTHKNIYRLDERTRQTAKVSEYLCRISQVSISSDENSDSEESPGEEMEEDGVKVKVMKKKLRKKPSKSMRWETPAKNAVIHHFSDVIEKRGKLPGRKECEKALRLTPLKGSGRKWTDVKHYVRNYIRKLAKGAEDSSECEES